MSDCYTDVIHITHEQTDEIHQIYRKYVKDDYIPSDLFFANTIPIKHFLVFTHDEKNIQGVRYHVLPKDEQTIFDDGSILVMTIEIGVSDSMPHIYFGIAIKDGDDYLVCSDVYIKRPQNGDLVPLENVNIPDLKDFKNRLSFIVSTWYGIEIAMLHPTVKEIFQHPKMKKERISKAERKDNDNKVYRYVRHHYIKTDELETAIYGKHSINRKALIWYVTGHWREYRKTGKKIFIQPYWKGALRETKQAKPRNREIILEEG